MGEPLRKLRHPSVSELLARRCKEIAGTGKALTIPDVKLLEACDLALRFTWWDEVGSLPTIKALMTTCRERSLDPEQASQSGALRPLHRADSRSSARGPATARPSTSTPRGFRRSNPERSSIPGARSWSRCGRTPSTRRSSEAARAMFVDPKSPWLPLIPVEEGRRDHPVHGPSSLRRWCASPRTARPCSRRWPTRRRSGRPCDSRRAWFSTRSRRVGSDGFIDVRVPDPADKPGVEVPIRTCDYVAWKLSALDGAPECLLTWPEARRDAAVTACAAYLRRYGPHLAAEYLADEPNTRNPIARLRFPALDRPATPDDVREGRAVFSATGEGEARTVALPSGYPVRARWLALKSFPVIRRSNPDPPAGDFLQDGWVWQAEEVLKGDRWERSYGFVGHATIARVAGLGNRVLARPRPAAELAGRPVGTDRDGRATVAVFRPGQPVLVTLRLLQRPGESSGRRRRSSSAPGPTASRLCAGECHSS